MSLCSLQSETCLHGTLMAMFGLVIVFILSHTSRNKISMRHSMKSKKTDVWCDLGYAWGCILTSNKCDLAFGNFGNYPHLDMMWHDVANSSPWFSPFNPEAPYGCWLTKSASSARRRSISNTAQENEQSLKRSWGHCPELLSYWTGQFICDIYICYITMSELIMRILSLSYWDMLQVWTTDS